MYLISFRSHISIVQRPSKLVSLARPSVSISVLRSQSQPHPTISFLDVPSFLSTTPFFQHSPHMSILWHSTEVSSPPHSGWYSWVSKNCLHLFCDFIHNFPSLRPPKFSDLSSICFVNAGLICFVQVQFAVLGIILDLNSLSLAPSVPLPIVIRFWISGPYLLLSFRSIGNCLTFSFVLMVMPVLFVF